MLSGKNGLIIVAMSFITFFPQVLRNTYRPLFIVLLSTLVPLAFLWAQTPSYETYQKQFQNTIGVADTVTEKLLAQRQAIRSGYDMQAMEGPIDPATYKLGPGDGVYLDVYTAHSLDHFPNRASRSFRAYDPRSGKENK
jgi:hypothetical protein